MGSDASELLSTRPAKIDAERGYEATTSHGKEQCRASPFIAFVAWTTSCAIWLHFPLSAERLFLPPRNRANQNAQITKHNPYKVPLEQEIV